MQETVAMTQLNSAKQRLPPFGAPTMPAGVEMILDALAELLQNEGAQQFQHEFLEQVENHSVG